MKRLTLEAKSFILVNSAASSLRLMSLHPLYFTRERKTPVGTGARMRVSNHKEFSSMVTHKHCITYPLFRQINKSLETPSLAAFACGGAL